MFECFRNINIIICFILILIIFFMIVLIVMLGMNNLYGIYNNKCIEIIIL